MNDYYKYTVYGSLGTYESAITIETQDKIRFVISEYGQVEDEDYKAIINCSEKKKLTENEFLVELFKCLSYGMIGNREAILYFQELCCNVETER